MRPPSAQHSYGAVSNQDHDGSLPASPREHGQHNFKPVPLRSLSLVTLILIFATNIVLIELLLRNAVDVASSLEPSSTPTPTKTSQMVRARRQDPANKVLPRSSPDIDCSDPSILLDRIADGEAVTTSLCADFTSSYAAYTRNLSYAQQTGLQQWIDDFSAASWSILDLKMACTAYAHQMSAGISQGSSLTTSAPADSDGVSAIQIGCSTSIVTFDPPDCSGYGTLSISNFQLQSSVLPVCAAVKANELVIATPDVVTQSAIWESELLISIPPPASTPASALPTITQQAKPNPDTSGWQPDATAAAVTPIRSKDETPTQIGQERQSVTGGVAPSPQVVTLSTTGSNGRVQIVTATGAAVPLANTYVITDGNGQVQTLVSTTALFAPGAYLYTTTGPDGQVQTVATQIGGGPKNPQTIVKTNSLGQSETIVAPASALVSAATTYTTTDAQGHKHTITASAYAVAGLLTTYTTADARGRVETSVRKISSDVARYTTTTQYTSLIRTTDAAGRSTSFSAVVVETVTLSTTPASDSVSKTSSAIASAATIAKPNFVISSQEKMVNTKFTYGSYFLALYMPALLAVIVKAAWEMVFSAIKLIQPFERMANVPASAEYSVFAQYLSSSLSWDAFTSLAQGNPVPLLASFLYILVTVGGLVAPASMRVQARSYCEVEGIQMRCDPVWVVNVVLLRGVEVALGVCLGLVLLMLRSVIRRKSGVSSDPSSLASLAALMNHGPLLNDIQRIDPGADSTTYKRRMAHHLFFLDHHKNSSKEVLYGIIGERSTKANFETSELETNSLSSTVYISSTTRQYNYHSIPDPSRASSFAPKTFLRRACNHLVTDTLGLLLPLTLFTLILTWYLDNNDDPLNDFFNSNTLWPKLLLVALATLSALHLSHLERVVRITEPFRRLTTNSDSTQSRRYRPSSGETTLLISRSGTTYSNLLHCIYLLFSQDLLRRGSGRMFFQTLVTVTAVLADLNIIAAAGVAFNHAQTWRVYKMSSIASITLSAWTVLVYLIVMLWWRRCESVRAVSDDGMGVDVGVGTIAGTMRWLLSGQNSREVLEAVANVREEADGRRLKRWDADTEYRGRREMDPSKRDIWFGKMGSVHANGLQRWGFGIDGNSKLHERMSMYTRRDEKGAETSARHQEYFIPPAKGAEMGNEHVSEQGNPLPQRTSWQGGRFPSVYGHNPLLERQVSREDERLWGADGDLGTR